MTNSPPSRLYERLMENAELIPDSSQQNALEVLDKLHEELTLRVKYFEKPWYERLFSSAPKTRIKGVYLYGDVGRGKSMVMDLFLESLPGMCRVRRVHFHSFMLDLHDALHNNPEGGILEHIEQLSKQVQVLCFDEFHVNDVADAMILQRLFTALINQGLVVVTTSNYPPDRLYEGGLQRARFQPFIELIKERLHIVEIKGAIDYRARDMGLHNTYLYPLNTTTTEHCARLFRQMSGGESPEETLIEIKRRELRLKASGDIALCSFSQLCEQPAGASDYLALAHSFSTIFITDIPKMGYDRRNEAKRFMTLIDVLYEAGSRIVMTAQCPPEELYKGHDHQFEFSRIISRIHEVTSQEYLQTWEKNH